jgi:hypothetical protein
VVLGLAALLVVVGGAAGLGLGIGGMRLPRCDPQTSRLALIASGIVGLCLGLLLGIDRIWA